MAENQKRNQQELPYERFLRFGPESLTEAELLAIIIRTGTKEKNALQLAEEVLQLARYPREGLLGLYEIKLEELENIKGIGEVKAVKLKCLAELSMRMSSATAKTGIRIKNAAQAASLFMERLRHRDTECVFLLSLDAKCRVLREKKLSEGSVRSSLISPREIFLEALDAKAVNIMLLHNHPSGDPAPSGADREITAHLKEMGGKMDIPLLDHIIIGDNQYYSFKESSWLGE
ncbi:MAG: DNA repair protein RadC [Roseburia sp.]|nr:DNA repair protein RadC [Roseburia sp.]MCM1098067.1 DNA repair protein RadC [Ruminococcus flavefaciens]